MNNVMDKPEKIILNHTETLVATEKAKGLSQKEIGNKLAITQSAVSRQLAKPEVKELTERLRNTLKERYVAKFIKRTVKEAKASSKLTDYMLGTSNDNKTRYETPEQIEKFLTRQDKTANAILRGVGILDSNTIHIGNTNTQINQVISPSYQAFLDFQSTQGGAEYPQDELIDVNSGDSNP